MSDFNYSDCFADFQAIYQVNKNGIGKGLHDLPAEQWPRERLMNYGAGALSDAELLAVLLSKGIEGKTVSELARELLNVLDRNKEIPSATELMRIGGMGTSKACAVLAMLEFGRRRWGSAGTAIKFPRDIFSLIRHYADRKQERFISLSLNGANEVLSVRMVTVGLVNKTIVHPREVFADLIEDRASAFIVAHNHPSGQLTPSPEDDEITERLQNSAVILGLHFLDHLIFSQSAWWSYRQNGRLENYGVNGAAGLLLKT